MTTPKPDPKRKTELVVSTYWPTRILKSLQIYDLTRDYGNSITLDREQSKYLYEQLKALYGDASIKSDPPEGAEHATKTR